MLESCINDQPKQDLKIRIIISWVTNYSLILVQNFSINL